MIIKIAKKFFDFTKKNLAYQKKKKSLAEIFQNFATILIKIQKKITKK